jgi:uncharacterized surface protein with fasciclin (FAS1) repeats
MKRFNITKFVIVLLLVAFAFGSFAPTAQAAGRKGNTIVDVALAANAQTGEFSILIAALQAADPSVIQTLSGKRQYTVFAPTDAAFVSLLGELGLTADELLSDKELVTKVLLYHVAQGRRNSQTVLASERIRTLESGFLYQSGGVLTDENGRTANIVAVDIKASNGIIHVIDRVVLPAPEKTLVDVALEANAQTGEFSILIAALQAADPSVLETLSGRKNYTVFAPTDAAFISLLGELGLTADELLSQKDLVTQVLLYHVARGKLDAAKVLASDKIKTLEGGFLYQSGGILTDENGRTANIVATDIKADNGIIHVIDRVVLPVLPTPEKTIVDVALEANAQTGEFSILIAALQAADPSVLQTLSGKGQFTVFAPTDAAFVALLGELGLTANELLSQKDLVTQVLLYHVANGRLDSTAVLASDKIKTLEGGFLYQSGGVLTDENGRTANIVTVDIMASNGIIHVIDRVVLPDLSTPPSKQVLDDFNRADGKFDGNWSGNKSKYRISSNQLQVWSNDANSDIYWNEAFGADQEAFVTFADVNEAATEQNLLLKAQSNQTWGDGVILVFYDAKNYAAQVWTWEWPKGWVKYGDDIPVTFTDGDTFTARARADGIVEVYRNGTLLDTRDITSWSYYDEGGYIGLWFMGARDAVLDDFGGGNIP